MPDGIFDKFGNLWVSIDDDVQRSVCKNVDRQCTVYCLNCVKAECGEHYDCIGSSTIYIDETLNQSLPQELQKK